MGITESHFRLESTTTASTTTVSSTDCEPVEDCREEYIIKPTAATPFWYYGVPVLAAGVLLTLFGIALWWILRTRARLTNIKGPILPTQMQLARVNKNEAVRFQQIKRTEFVIDERCLLGRGKGGIVYGGTFGGQSVAVKTLNPSCLRVDMYLDSMHREIEIFNSLFHHPNIIKLLAFSYASPRVGERIPDCYILMELCSLGALRDFLLTKLYYGLTSGTHDHDVTAGYSDRDMLGFAYEIAVGAEYLAEQRVVHGDLACRNVLLALQGSELMAKITDFGLARKLDEEPTYTKTTNEPIPWKWAAPEVIARNEFSVASDVWSFGVLMWEIFSRGEEPYKGVSWSSAFPDELYEGRRRLAKPQLATMELYRLMKKCWASEPATRIGFAELRAELGRILNPEAAVYITTTKEEPDNKEQGQIGVDGYLVQFDLKLPTRNYANAAVDVI